MQLRTEEAQQRRCAIQQKQILITTQSETRTVKLQVQPNTERRYWAEGVRGGLVWVVMHFRYTVKHLLSFGSLYEFNP